MASLPSRGFSHFVTSMTAPVASGWSGCRVGLAPTGKRRLSTAHAKSRLPRWRVLSKKKARTSALTCDQIRGLAVPPFQAHAHWV